ncbi:ADP-dependent (S)-NAD(P)H-hydrate dehydratase [Siccirubricoccus deserti]|uniref:ADP-dependent (S)-NAD(P)H-hydrate dehydratase n=1 Tax=Siccirubricoccus deserti TaxID=2013562 RepID=A0A9X0R4G2_9PROT|nr:NAD(P)H-hydrate dehydratase [Siccirubricoccus deserti]MBC4019294.1 NAD(P)H-hydrate dehydratase [Siccirubricoccus deserti]GGC72993.1 ADP-dependent (S)-NAD(P)H-hydrate dehydratase [Siccirubricoccus deserti]
MSATLELTPALLRGMPLPEPEGGDKEGRGRVLVVGGSLEVPGGMLLAGTAALRVGAGKLQMATCRSIAPHLALAVPEARVFGVAETPGGGIAPAAAAALRHPAGQCGAVLIGPGMLEQAEAATLAAALLEVTPGAGFVLDAAAMSGLSRLDEGRRRRHGGRVVITPHAGEMAGLLGMTKEAVEADPLATALSAASMLCAVVALKGATTWIADPDGRAWVNRHGCVGLGTSGSGDTLAGFIAGLLARGAAPAQATAWGVYMHAEAGRRLARAHGPLGFLAREIPGEIPRIMANLGSLEGEDPDRPEQ